MGVRETLNKNPRLTTYALGGVILIALVCIASTLMGTGGPKLPTKSFFTIDDGQTCFTDDINKIAPFDRGGKEAYRVQFFRCGKDSKPFIGYMERYTPEAKARLEELRSVGSPSGAMDLAVRNGIEVKKPGDKAWVKQSDYQKSQAIMSPSCPDPAAQNIEAVFPP